MTTPTERLDAVERLRFMKLEKDIKAGLTSTVATWIALEEVRDRRFYRETHKTFDDYCQNKWNMSRRYADMLIKNGAVVQALPKEMRTMVLKQRAIRELATVEADKRVEVLKLASKNGAPTAKTINEAKNQAFVPARATGAGASPFVPPPKVYDDTGFEIPVAIQPLWNRGAEVKAIMQQLSDVKCRIDKAKSVNDPLYVEIRDSLIADLKMAREAVSYALPYAVCPACQGKDIKRCTFCKGRGLVSEQLYLKADKSMRDMRAKFSKKK